MTAQFEDKKFPYVFINRTTLSSRFQNNIVDKTHIELDLSLKQDPNKDNVRISNSNSFDNSIKICILQVLNENLSAFLATSKELVILASKREEQRLFSDLILRLAYNKSLITTDPVSGDPQARQIASNELNELLINEDFLNIKQIKNLPTKIHEEVIENQEKQNINYYLSESFEITGQTRHLSYFIVVDYDEEQVTKNIHDSVRDSVVVSDIIINKGNLVSQTFSFFLEDGTQWLGSYHKDTLSNNWFTGSPQDSEETKRKLTRNVYFNSKIQDFRVFESLKSLRDNSLDGIEQKLFNSILKNQYKEPQSEPIKFIGRTQSGVLFNIHKNELLEKHSQAFRFINISTIPSKDQWIDNIIVYKKRVKTKNYVGERTAISFSEKEMEKEIESNYIAISENNKVISVNIIDPELKEQEGLQFCYGIKVFFSDPILPSLEIMLNSLQENFKFLKLYEHKSIIPQTQHVDGSFNYQTNKFSDLFKEEFAEDNRLSTSIEVLFSAIEKLYTVSEKEKYAVAIQSLINPMSATPLSISKYIDLYQHFITIYTKLIFKCKTYNPYVEERYFNKIENICNSKTALSSESLFSISNTGDLQQDIFANRISSLQKNASLIIKKQNRVLSNFEKENLDGINKNDLFSISNFIGKNNVNIESSIDKKPLKATNTNIFKDSLQETKKNIATTIEPMPTRTPIGNVKIEQPLVETVQKIIKEEQKIKTEPGLVQQAISRSNTEFSSNRNVSQLTLQELQVEAVNKKIKKQLNINKTKK